MPLTWLHVIARKGGGRTKKRGRRVLACPMATSQPNSVGIGELREKRNKELARDKLTNKQERMKKKGVG